MANPGRDDHRFARARPHAPAADLEGDLPLEHLEALLERGMQVGHDATAGST